MNPVELCQRYFQAWNRRDAGAVLETIAPGGTYQDPATPGPLAGEALRGYLAQLWSAFPDLRFEPGRVHRVEDRLVHGEWTMLGTNTGSLRGLPPTGRSVRLPGIDVIETGEHGITRIVGYYDSALLPLQLGLDVVVQPKEAGPLRFGVANTVRRAVAQVPRTLVFTELEVDDPQAIPWIRDVSRDIVLEQMPQEGFLSFTGTVVGRRLTTVSTWASTEQMQAAMRRGRHAEAMREFFRRPGIEGGFTAVFDAQRVGPWHRRCGACGKLSTIAATTGSCGCGAPLQALA